MKKLKYKKPVLISFDSSHSEIAACLSGSGANEGNPGCTNGPGVNKVIVCDGGSIDGTEKFCITGDSPSWSACADGSGVRPGLSACKNGNGASNFCITGNGNNGTFCSTGNGAST